MLPQFSQKYSSLRGDLKFMPIKDSSIFDNLHLCSMKEISVCSVLSAGCATTQGVRLLRKWLTQPLMDASQIAERQDIVAAFVENDELRERLRTIELKTLPDISKVTLKFAQFAKSAKPTSSKAVLAALLRINTVCKRLPVFMELFDAIDNTALQSQIKQPITFLDGKIQKLVMMIDSHVEVQGKVKIKAGVNDELDAIAQRIETLESRMEEVGSHVASELGIPDKDVKLDETNEGMVFRVHTRHDKEVSKGGDFERLGTTKSTIAFTNRALRKLCQEWQEKSDEYEEHASAIIQDIIRIVNG